MVGMYDVNADAVAQTAEELGDVTVTGVFDVTDPDGWNRALTEFVAATGRLDVLVNNAGILYSGALTEITLEQHYRLLDVNIKGLLTGCYCALPHLRRTPGATVVNLASASALFGQPGIASYAASKAAVRSLTEALDLEWSGLGIGVHDISPLFVSTGMIDDLHGASSPASLGVRITPEDVAAAVWRTVRRRRRLVPTTHVLVGRQTRLLSAAMAVSPFWINRLVVSRLSGAAELARRVRRQLV